MSEYLFALLDQLENDPAFPESSGFLTDGDPDELPDLVMLIVYELEDYLKLGLNGYVIKTRQALEARGCYFLTNGDCPALVTRKGSIAFG